MMGIGFMKDAIERMNNNRELLRQSSAFQKLKGRSVKTKGGPKPGS